MDTLLERPSNPSITVPLVLLVTYAIYNRLHVSPSIPSELPWVGRDPSKLFSQTRVSLASLTNYRQWLNEGYQKAPLFPLAMATRRADET